MGSSVKSIEENNVINRSEFYVILSILEDYFGMKLLVKSRNEKVVYARMIMYRILLEIGYKKIQIAEYCNKHHSSIINALDNFEQYISYDKELLLKYESALGRVTESISETNPLASMTKKVIIDKVLTLEKRISQLSSQLMEAESKLRKYKRYDRLIKTIDTKTPDEQLIAALTIRINQILNT